MEPLFDKQMDELREAFVRQRFAEPNVFGRPDIEKWLEEQRKNLGKGIDFDPWECDGFDHYALAVSGNDAPEICRSVVMLLRTCVTASTHKPDWSEQDSSTSNFVELLEMLRAGGTEVFYSTSPAQNDFLAVVIIGEKPYIAAKQMHGDKSEVASFSKTNVIAGLHLLDEEIRSERPKAAQALKYLLNQYRLAIAAARESAQRDFDEAVAVSADGTKIVRAKWVFVAEGYRPTSGQLFPANAFRQSKIRCGPTINHVNIEHWMLDQISLDRRALTLDRFLKYILICWGRSSVVNVIFLVSNTMCRDILQPGETILFVDKNNYPFPLPDGGREIRV